MTPEDVIFSLEAFKKYHPQYSAYYRHVTKSEKTGDREVTFTFDQPGNRELPQIIGQINVLPKHWWEGKDSQGRQRDVSQTTLEAPLGCGAYRVKAFVPGRSIVYERVPDYWGDAVNVNVGINNFDEMRFEYFRDTTVALEAFKADQLDWRNESSAKDWATAYDFPAVTQKRVLLEEFDIRNFGVMQAFAFNTRRDKFKDARVRRAFNFAFDFDEMNKQIFFGQYSRIASYFQGTELASSGLPKGLELEILNTVKDKVPPEVFTTAYTNPVGGNPEAVRNNLREALRLFRDAGWEVKDQKLTNVKTGEKMTIEVLISAPTFERVVSFWKPLLEKVGVDVSIRVVDASQYENRLRNWDFDMVIASWGQSLSPGNEQRDYWGSQAADQPGSRNYIGIKDPAIDALIDRIIFSKSRDELTAATHAMDRVLLWHQFRGAAMDLRQGSHRALGSLWPSRSAAEIRLVGLPDGVVVGCRTGREGGLAFVSGVTRRSVLTIAAGAPVPLTLGRGLRAQGRESHGISAFGDLKYPRRFPAARLCQSGCAEGRHVLADRLEPAIQPELPHLQYLQQLHPEGRRGARHGAHLCKPDVGGCRRARFDVRACCARGADIRRRADLSLPDAAAA